MMKRLLLLSSLLFATLENEAQVYSYNFGSTVDSITSGSVSGPAFPPAPPDGGGAYARVGTGGGKVVIRSHPNFGTGSSLRIQAPTAASVNKFSIYNMPNASTTFGIRFTFSIGDSVNSSSLLSSGVFTFLAGKGNIYSNGSTLSGNQTFTGIQLTNGALGATAQFRNGGSWSAIPLFLVTYGTTTNVAIYMNNGSTSVTYTGVDNTSRSLASGTWDFYVNGVYASNFSKAELPADTVINSFMFYAASSTGNLANLFIDDIVYTNNIVNNTLPLKLDFFDALPDNNTVRLFWKTEVETGIKEYIVEHSKDGRTFAEAGKVTSLKTNGSSYTFTHTKPSAINFYRLRIINEDGTAEFSQVITLRLQKHTELKAWYSENAIHIAEHKDAIIKVYDLTGKRVVNTMLKNSDYALDLAFLAPGSYIAHITSEKETAVVKFVK